MRRLVSQCLDTRERGIVAWRLRSERRDVPIGVLCEQQPSEWGVPSVITAGPPDHALLLGPGQRDIGEAQFFAALLDQVLAMMAVKARAANADVERSAICRIRVVKVDRRVVLHPGWVPEIRAVDDWKFKTLAAMDGEDLDRLSVGFKTPTAFLF